MQAQRACEAVNSNEHERSMPLNAIRADKDSFHEPDIGVECIRGACPRAQVYSCPYDRSKIGTSNRTFKVEDQRRIVSSVWIDSLDWSREKEVKSRKMWYRHWEVAQSRRAARSWIFIRPES